MNKSEAIKVLKNIDKCLKIIPETSEWYEILLKTQSEILKTYDIGEI